MASPAALNGTHPKITPKALKQAARQHGGIVSLVAQYFGVSRNAIYAHIDKDPEISQAFEDAEEVILDLAEAKHIEAIRSGYYPAISFHLRTKGRKRGYTSSVTLDSGESSGGFILEVVECKIPDRPKLEAGR
jgi:hypothetical protein